MLELDDPHWKELRHAYGPASDLPSLLKAAARDLRPGHRSGTPWFELWSALCHQEDVFSASYAALPHLIALAPEHLRRRSWDAMFLASMIEICRAEGRGPGIPPLLAKAYTEAVSRGARIASEAIGQAWDEDAKRVLAASEAALGGDSARARRLLGETEE
jgi:hypothetical protein